MMQKRGSRTKHAPAPTFEAIAAYIRASTDEQAESGLGLAAQRTRCLAMATVKGWPEPVFYADEGISGKKDIKYRPALLQLMEDVRAGKIHALIVPSLDRLGRKVHIVISIVEELRQQNVSLVSCKESLDTSTPQGQFVLIMFAALAQLEGDVISQRAADALAERGKRDGEKGGKVPYGCRRIFEQIGEKRICTGIEIDPDAASVVRRIFALHRRGKSLREIAEAVSDGKQWRHTSIVEILQNKEAYRGGKRGASEVRWPVILK